MSLLQSMTAACLAAVASILAVPVVHAVPVQDASVVREAPKVVPGDRVGVGRRAVLPSVDTIDGRPLEEDVRPIATVLVMTSTTCPLSLRWAPVLADLEKAWSSRGVRTMLVDVQGNDDEDDLRRLLDDAGFAGEAIHDPSRAVAGALGALTTTEAFVLDDRGTIRYRGAVDDRIGLGYVRAEPRTTPLADAVDAVVGGGVVPVAATTSPGCDLGLDVVRPRLEEEPTWHGTISRLLDTHCVDCHRDGGVGPFPLDDEAEARANAGMIARQVERGLMPPWFAAPDPHGGESPWMNDRSLAAEERDAIVAWARGRRLSGDPGQGPRADARDRPRPGSIAAWSIGEPDLVLEIPEEIEIPADGYLDYVNVTVDTGFREDRWIEAWEVVPTALDAVHHVLVFVRDPASGQVDRDGFLAAYVPGHRAMDYTDPAVSGGRTMAKRLPAGARLYLQLHYTPNGRATTDRTRIGLRFADAPPETEVMVTSLANRRFRIPPGAEAHPVSARLRVPDDVRILSFLPHMHVRGRSYRYELVAPDGTREVLLDVPDYDFNWQLNYVHAEPRLVPAGSTLEGHATFDNSAGNPANPDPSDEVRWGDQTFEEMMLGYVEYLVPRREAADIAAEAGMTPARIMALLDRDGDGVIARRECPRQYREVFRRLDRDDDRRVTWEELEEGLAGRRGQRPGNGPESGPDRD